MPTANIQAMLCPRGERVIAFCSSDGWLDAGDLGAISNKRGLALEGGNPEFSRLITPGELPANATNEFVLVMHALDAPEESIRALLRDILSGYNIVQVTWIDFSGLPNSYQRLIRIIESGITD